MFQYGFELEAFYHDGLGIAVPPKTWPTDGYPGLVEFRTTGFADLDQAYFNLLKEINKYDINFISLVSSHTFTKVQNKILRSRHSIKQAWDITNLYNKPPRNLGNKTIASFQINISNLIKIGYTDENKIRHPDIFGLLDIPRIVRNLDKEFENQIKESGRQLGEYCIKGNRLEYRSLPNLVACFDMSDIKILLNKIKKAVEQN